jgi:hypothetical protein
MTEIIYIYNIYTHTKTVESKSLNAVCKTGGGGDLREYHRRGESDQSTLYTPMKIS